MLYVYKVKEMSWEEMDIHDRLFVVLVTPGLVFLFAGLLLRILSLPFFAVGFCVGLILVIPATIIILIDLNKMLK